MEYYNLDDEPVIEMLLDIARQHGEDSEPDHEVGDLQDLLRPMWKMLTSRQRQQFLRIPEVQQVVSGAGMVDLATTMDDVFEDEWDEVVESFGLDDSFQYDDESMLAYVNRFRLESALPENEGKTQRCPRPKTNEDRDAVLDDLIVATRKLVEDHEKLLVDSRITRRDAKAMQALLPEYTGPLRDLLSKVERLRATEPPNQPPASPA